MFSSIEECSFPRLSIRRVYGWFQRSDANRGGNEASPLRIAQISGSHRETVMLADFITLAYSFCAAIVPAGGADLVAVGYVSSNRCFVQVETIESTRKVIDGHDILVEIIEGGAVVGIDTLRFVVPKAPSV
jgi:hypothetical protein